MKSWPRYATIATLILVIGFVALIYGYRLGLWGLKPVFGALRGFPIGGMPLLIVLLFLGALTSVAASGTLLARKSVLPALAALVVAAAAGGFGYLPIWMGQQASSVPPIHDITTDTLDPPAFVAILPLRADASNPAEYDAGQTAAQLEAYPDIRTLVMPVPLPEAYMIALDAVRAEGLALVASVPEEGRIEATETVPLFGFKDDVVIRLRNAHGTATVVDIRSKSRVGRSDLGFNARRIRSMMDFMAKKGGSLEMPYDAAPADAEI